MRISDWSSDVCSSDLQVLGAADKREAAGDGHARDRIDRQRGGQHIGFAIVLLLLADIAQRRGEVRAAIGRPADRQSVVSGKSVSVRVDLGGHRIIKTKKNQCTTIELSRTNTQL